MSEETVKFSIIDIGSGSIRAGFSGDDKPAVTFPTVVGTGGENNMGAEATGKLQYPVKNGVINNWNLMEQLLRYTYKKVGIEASEYPSVLTEQPLVPKAQREKLTQIMFETFNVPAFYLGLQQVFALYENARTTGVVLDVGDDLTNIVPCFEGIVALHSAKKVLLGGKRITNYLNDLLQMKGYNGTVSVTNSIKEQCCYVASNFEEESQKEPSSLSKDFTLPDGNVITLDVERFNAPECLFQPDLLDMDPNGIHQLLYDAVQKNEEYRDELYQNIVLAGGSTLFEGFQERVKAEVQAKLGVKPVKVFAPSGRNYSAWAGASITASLSSFWGSCISKEEYDEKGPSIIHEKCPNSL